MKVSKLSLISIFCMIAFMAIQAQETEKPARESDPSPVINASKLAIDLANYGYDNKSPLALIEAARIISANPFRTLTPVQSEPSSGNDGDKKQKHPEISVPTLISDAKSFAAADKAVLAVITQTEQAIQKQNADEVATRGRVYGPARVTRRVYGNSSYIDYVTFEGRKLAEVLISGDGDTDLDLYVYDENGNLVGSDDDYTDDCYVSFVPRWTGTYKIKVVNRGSIYNQYLLLTN